MNIEAHEHNPQLPAERSGQRLLLGNLHVCSRTSPPRKVLGERRRNGVTGRLGIIPKESSFSPTPFYFRACLGRSDAAIQCPAFQLLVVAGSIDGNIQVEDHTFAMATLDAGSADEVADEDWNPDRSVPETVHMFLGKDIGLTRRHLPHSCLSHLYWLFVATCGESPGLLTEPCITVRSPGVTESCSTVPSYHVFSDAWHSVWHQYLLFRKVSQHAECKACFHARTKIHDRGISFAERLGYAREWRDHLRDQYHDRTIYWHNRYASRSKQGVLTIIIDSMDKAKFAWPQYEWGRVDKTLDTVRRPRLVLTAAIAHGYGTFFFVADEDLTHGADAFLDVLERVLETVWAECRREGLRFPDHLVVQSDNTTAQAKNSEVNVFMAYLVVRYKFRTTHLMFLIVGHTHEDIDQLFGLVLQVVLRVVKFQTKGELVELLRTRMRHLIEGRGETLHVDVLEHVRDFHTWLAPLKVELYNCWGTRRGVEAPHAFSYKLRRDLDSHEAAAVETRRGCGTDVMCCVKTYMHSPQLQQSPLVVLPRERYAAAALSAGPVAMVQRHKVSAQRKEELMDLARLLRGQPYNMHRGADDLERFVAGPGPASFPATPWLQAEAADWSMPAQPGTELTPHLPETSWPMRVRFKR